MGYRTGGRYGDSSIPLNLPAGRFRRLGDPLPPDGRPARGYGDEVQSRFPGRGAGLGSLSATGQQGTDEAKAKIAEAQIQLKQLAADAATAQASFNDGIAKIQAVGVQAAVDDANLRVGGVIQKIAAWAAQQASQLGAIQVPPPMPQFYPQTDKIWHDVNDGLEPRIAQNSQALQAAVALLPSIASNAQAAQSRAAAGQQQADQRTVQSARSQALGQMNAGNFDGALAILQAQPVQDAAARIGFDLSSDLSAITSAKANATGAKQQQADGATVQRARSQALALMNQGNFVGALAALQSQNVTDAASRIGFDLSADVAAVTGAQSGAQRTSDAQAAAAKAQADCEGRGGTWTGTRCDLSAATSAKASADANARVDAALSRAETLSSAGSYRAALMVLSGVATDAQVAGRQSDVAVLSAQVQSDRDGARCSAAGGTWDGSSCTMPAAPPPAPISMPGPPAPAGPDPQVECIKAGGQWDGTTCSMPPPSWIGSLIDRLFSSPPPPPAAPAAAGPALVSQGPSMQQLEAIAILQAFGGPQGRTLADALSGTLSPQGPFSSRSAPDGTSCVQSDGSPGILQGGSCRTVAPPSGVLYGRPEVESF